MTFTTVSIENFRGIQSFTCDRLARVTLIVGRNNSGKSTLLEALLLLANRRTTEILPILNVTRQLATLRVADLDTLFHNPTKPLSVRTADSSGVTRGITVSRIEDTAAIFVAPPNAATVTPEPHYHLEQTFHDARESADIAAGTLSFSEKSQHANWELHYETMPNAGEALADPLCVLIPARGGDVNFRFIKKLFLERGEAILAEALKGVDPRIQSIQLIEDRLMVGLEGFPRLFPFQIMGDGIFRLLTILPALWVCRGGCVCIDEIDNGLHNSAQAAVWQTLIRCAQEWDVQIIATSHHLDLLNAIAAVHKAHPDAIPPEDFAYLVLSREGDAIRSLAFNLNDLTSAIELGLEVR